MTSTWHFKDLLRNGTQNFLILNLKSLSCLHPSSLQIILTITSLHQIDFSLPFSTETTKKFPAERKTTENLRMYSVTLINEHKSSTIFGKNSGSWSTRHLSTFVISRWNNHRGAERIGNRKEDRPWESPFTKEGECRSKFAKPTGIKRGEDITGSFED